MCNLRVPIVTEDGTEIWVPFEERHLPRWPDGMLKMIPYTIEEGE